MPDDERPRRLATPALLATPSLPSPASPRTALASLLAVGALAGWLVGLHIDRQQQDEAEAHRLQRLGGASTQLADELLQRMRRFELGLSGLRGAYLAAQAPGFDARSLADGPAARDLAGEFPGALGLGIAERGTALGSGRLEARVQFSNTLASAHLPPGADAASTDRQRQAARAAARSAGMVLSEPEAGPTPRVMAWLPIYLPGPPLLTADERERACVGWAFALLEIPSVVAALMRPHPELRLRLRDGARVLDAPTQGMAAEGGWPPPTRLLTRRVFGRDWQLAVAATPEFAAGETAPAGLTLARPVWVGALAGGMLGGILGGVSGGVSGGVAGGVWGRVLAGLRLALPRRQRRVAASPEVPAEAPAQRPALLPAPPTFATDDARLQGGDSQRQLADALRENEALLQTIKEQGLYSMADVRGTILDVNEGFCRISGYRREELIGQNHRIVNSGTHSREFWVLMWRTIASGQAWRGEICNRSKDGSLYWVHSIMAPFRGADGQIEKYISIRNDITARKVASDTLALERARLDHILRGMHAGTWEWNVATAEMHLNERWAEIVGYRLAELGATTTATWQQFLHPDDRERSAVAIRRHFAGETDQFEIEARVQHRDGHWVWVLDRGRVSSLTADGRAAWMHGTRQDVSERHAAEDALRDASRLAQSASAAKSSFLANISHEIRTPLNAVIGLGYLLQHANLAPEPRGWVHQIQLAGRTLLGLVNDVLDLTKIEAGEVTLETRPFLLQDLVADLAAVHGEQARAKGVDFQLLAPPASLPSVCGDETRLGQVLGNLLSNAIKFTERGSVSFAIEAADLDAQALQLRITVVDTGIGIEPAARPRVFDRFSQADASTTRRFGGTGLGLSIVRQLVELMGGGVGCSSTLGEGSSFWVDLTLPYSTQPARAVGADSAAPADPSPGTAHVAQPSPWAGPSSQPLRLHLEGWAEDEATALRTEAARLGWECRLGPAGASDASDAGEATDIRVVRTPAGMPPGAPGLPPVRLPESWQGMTLPLARLPPSAGELFDAVHALWRGRHADGALSATRLNDTRLAWLQGVRVLVVDDSAINREVAALVLSHQGAQVQTCESGAQALALLGGDVEGGGGGAPTDLSAPNPQACDVVLMDIQMPGLDGYETTRQLRRLHRLSSLATLPIIALTAGAMLTERQHANDAGMDAFLTKPLDPDALIRAVRRHVERHRGTAIGVGQAAREAPTAPPPWPPIEGIDMEDVNQRLSGDLRLFRELLSRLCQDYEDVEQLHALPTPLLPEQRAAWAARVHKLRGSAGMLGAAPLHRAATELETWLADSAGPHPSPQAWQRPALAVAQALQNLRRAQAADAAARSALSGGAAEAADVALHDPQALARLMLHLQQQSLAALDDFRGVEGKLRACWGGAAIEPIADAVQQLNFQTAATLLQALGEPA